MFAIQGAMSVYVCVCVCVCVFVCFCACVCVCVFVGAFAQRVDSIIFLLSVSGRYSFSKNGSPDCFLEGNNFGEIKLCCP
jgi:hypothetical protein